ncbi:MAG: KGG domain-containing protein [Micavibrio sp.]
MEQTRNPADNLSREARSKGGRNSSGNFRHNPERAAEAGRKGGKASRGGGRRSENAES